MATDFIGFTIGGHHSTDLGLYRVSDGSRYNENLLPTISDQTVQVPGGDGTYYFGSYYTQRSIPISVAYDSLTEQKFREVRTILGSKIPQDLIFDETPYKIYKVKAVGNPTLKYICFGDDRIYKGEGQFEFIAYSPYARCPNDYKYQSCYTVDGPEWYHTKNLNEWKAAAGLLPVQGDFDTFQTIGENARVFLYNPGDIEADYTIQVGAGAQELVLSQDGNPKSYLRFNKPIELKTGDSYVEINSKLNLIEGVNSVGQYTGNIYNEYIKTGFFFKIPKCTITTADTTTFYIDVVGTANTNGIRYDYLYL